MLNKLWLDFYYEIFVGRSVVMFSCPQIISTVN